MNYIKKACVICLIFILPFITSACKNQQEQDNLTLYGILIYQKVPTNEDYESDKSKIKNLITIENSTISTNDLFLLYFNYNNQTNTNTTYALNENELNLEIYYETTEITSCLMYKDKNGNLQYSDFTTKSIDENDTIIHTLTNLTIVVSKSLSHKKG